MSPHSALVALRQLCPGAFLALSGCIASTLNAAVAPAAPGDLVATGVSPTRIDLKWTDNSDNESVFVIERRTGDAGAWQTVWENANRDFPQFEDMGLPPGATFEYRVKARASDGSESPPSNRVSATTPTTRPLYNNLLRDRLALASSQQWRKVPARQAVDGTQWTRWWSALAKENAPKIDWLSVDMGAPRTVDKIRLIWQRNWWARKYEIQISDDALSWKTALTVDRPVLQAIEERRFPPVTGRHLRFHGIESANHELTWGGYGGYSIYEFEAYAPGVDFDPLEWESSAMHRPVAATTRPELAAGAVDSHMGTFWSARHGRENSLTVDLGAERHLHAVLPFWHVGTEAYVVRASADGKAWRTIATESDFSITPVDNEEMREIHRKDFTVPERARYVQLAVTGNSRHADPNFKQIILQELLVHSTPAGAPRAPEELRATPEAAGRVALRWKDASNDETGFEVLRRELGTSRWQTIGSVARDVTRYDDAPASRDRSFVYRVRAVNRHGESLFSNEVREPH